MFPGRATGSRLARELTEEAWFGLIAGSPKPAPIARRLLLLPRFGATRGLVPRLQLEPPRPAMKRTYQASKVRRARTHGFLVRMKTRGGRAVINARRAKGRKRLAV